MNKDNNASSSSIKIMTKSIKVGNIVSNDHIKTNMKIDKNIVLFCRGRIISRKIKV